MGRERELEEPKDLILLLLSANGGQIDGRTALQKLSYFAGQSIGMDLGFMPHYYGPFSSEIESSTDISVYEDLVTETVQRIPFLDPISSFEPKKYHYQLTERGREYIRTQGLESRPEFMRIKRLVREIKEIVGLNPKPLSAAAKIHYLVSAEGQYITTEDIKEKALDVGWDLTGSEIEGVGNLLIRLGFLADGGS